MGCRSLSRRDFSTHSSFLRALFSWENQFPEDRPITSTLLLTVLWGHGLVSIWSYVHVHAWNLADNWMSLVWSKTRRRRISHNSIIIKFLHCRIYRWRFCKYSCISKISHIRIELWEITRPIITKFWSKPTVDVTTCCLNLISHLVLFKNQIFRYCSWWWLWNVVLWWVLEFTSTEPFTQYLSFDFFVHFYGFLRLFVN